jgi:hypothetical protein
MLSLIIWLLALYGACVIAWKVLITLWNRKQRNRTRVHAIVLVQNGADYIEGCLTPLLKGSNFFTRELEVTVLDIESTDETFKILEKLEQKAANLVVISCTEQDAKVHVSNLLDSPNELICYVDLRKIQNPRDVVYIVSRSCGDGI